jgi:hypothetical protein
MERGPYEMLQELDDLESLLEDLEEQGISGLAAHENIPGELRERMEELGVRDVQQLRDRLMHLHAEIDENEDELTISDS